MENLDLWEKYVLKHKGMKRYVHFDYRCDFAGDYVQERINDEQWVAAHAFYPFIHYVQAYKKAYKENGKVETKIKEREIHYSSHMDGCIFSCYAFMLNQKYNQYLKDNNLNEVSIAYRDCLHKAPFHFAAKAFNYIQEKGHCFIMIGDFTSFFDKINHKYLKLQLKKLLGVEELPKDYYAVFKNVTKFSACELTDILKAYNVKNLGEHTLTKFNKEHKVISSEVFKSIKSKIYKNTSGIGIPQGATISDVFANIYMMDFDKEVNAYVTAQGGMYMRYSDDTIIILPLTEANTTSKYLLDIKNLLKNYDGLVEQKDEKTNQYEYKDGVITPISPDAKEFIDYLGLRLTGKTIGLRPRSLSKYYYRMHRNAARIRRKKIGILKGTVPAKRNSYKRLYAGYGLSAKGETPTFINYIYKVDRYLKQALPNSDGLEKDNEVKALLHNGWKKKIRKAISIKTDDLFKEDE